MKGGYSGDSLGGVSVVESLNALLDWLRPNMAVLGWLGSGLVVVAGGVWTVWKHLSEKSKPSLTPAPASPTTVTVSIEQGKTHTPSRELLIREGRNSLQSIPDGDRIMTIVSCGFLFCFLFAMIWVLRDFAFEGWQLIPFALILYAIIGYWFWLLATMLLYQLATMLGKVRVVATDEFFFAETSFLSFASSKFAIAREWRFEDGRFVRRIDDAKVDLPPFPDSIHKELSAFLTKHWK